MAKDTKTFKRLHTALAPELNWDKLSTMAEGFRTDKKVNIHSCFLSQFKTISLLKQNI